jgi:hypothetical protein
MGKYTFPRGTPFWDRVIKTDTGCWEWQGHRNPLGYGRYYPAMGVKLQSHRHAYELTRGPIPEGMGVLHRCDNPPCCNPDHLFLGTPADNAADKIRKGRARTGTLRGTANPGAKFNADQVRSIRERVSAGETRTAIAKEFGVDISTISLITRHKHYKDVADADAALDVADADAALDALIAELHSSKVAA